MAHKCWRRVGAVPLSGGLAKRRQAGGSLEKAPSPHHALVRVGQSGGRHGEKWEQNNRGKRKERHKRGCCANVHYAHWTHQMLRLALIPMIRQICGL